MSAGNGNVQTTATNCATKVMAPIRRELASGVGNVMHSNGISLSKLPSLGPPRDLTLGGRGGGVAKKVFTPNLNVVRNKNCNVKTSKDTTVGRGRGRGKSTRGGSGRGGGNSSLIQTAGVFSEGAGAVDIRKSSSSYNSYSHSVDDSSSSMRKPILMRNENIKVDAKVEDDIIRDVVGDSDEDDFEEEKTEGDYIPIKLSGVKWDNIKSEKEIKRENVEIKEESNIEDVSPLAVAQKLQALQVQKVQQRQQQSFGSTPHYPQALDEFLNSAKQQLFLMQLPDVLPCENEFGESQDYPSISKAKDVSQYGPNISTPAAVSNILCDNLKNMEEGQVGKLLRYKSGKIKLLLGDSYFDVSMGMEPGFLQDLMSINTNRDERSGNMINLGPIEAKLTATPDWEYLLKQQEKSYEPV